MSRANKFNAKMRSIRIGKMGMHAKQADIEESKVVNESFDEGKFCHGSMHDYILI